MIKHIKYHLANYLPALRSPNYRLYFFGQGVSLIGTWMASVAEAWLIYPTLTNNQALLGIASMINLLPTTVLVLFTGVFADRVHKRTTVIVIQSIFAVISLILSLLVLTHTIQIWHVLLATFISGVIFSLDMPVRSALMLQLVEKKDYPSALSLNSGIFNVARSIGPAVAGFTIAIIGIAAAYFVNALSFLAVIGSVFLMKLPPHVKRTSEKSVLHELRESFAYIGQNKWIGGLLFILGAVTFFTWPNNTLLPVFAHDIYNVGEIGFGLMVSAFGLGAVVAAFSFSKVFHMLKSKYSFFVFTINLLLLSYVGFALIPSFRLSLIFLALCGWALGTLVNFVASLTQIYAPDHLRGRITSIYSFVLVGPMPFGALYASYMVGRIGPRFTLAVAVSLLAITCFLSIFLFGKKIKLRLDKLE